jgi:hypothetical protein
MNDGTDVNKQDGHQVSTVNSTRKGGDQITGLLSVEVKSAPVMAGTEATITLVIRNPFADQVVIDTIETPSAAPLLPRNRKKPAQDTAKTEKQSFWQRLGLTLQGFEVKELSFGPLVAHFPGARGHEINVSADPNSRVTFKTPIGPQDIVNISTKEGAEVIFDAPESTNQRDGGIEGKQIIPPHQEDIASFELRTAHWLLVTPQVLQLYVVIRYRLGNEQRSQVVPLSLSLHPPVTAIVLGGICGGILGYVAHLLSSSNQSFAAVNILVSVLGITVMATILAIVLSRQQAAKGFVTLEDFYGAFVVGVLLGYTGTVYFESALKAVSSTK